MKFFIFLSITALLLTSCHFLSGEKITGNGNVTKRDMSMTSFHSIEAGGSVTVRVRQDAATSLHIETDENLIEFLEVFVEENVLVVRAKDGYNLKPSKDIIIHAAAPEFKDLDVSGSVDIISDNAITSSNAMSISLSGSGDIKMDITAPKLTASISGSGSMSLRGTVQNFSANISGSGEIRCFDLNTDVTALDLSGASNAEVTASKMLSVNISGAGSVAYKGAAAVTQDISGAGSIKKVD